MLMSCHGQQVPQKAVVVVSSDVRSTSALRFHILHSVLGMYEIQVRVGGIEYNNAVMHSEVTFCD